MISHNYLSGINSMQSLVSPLKTGPSNSIDSKSPRSNKKTKKLSFEANDLKNNLNKHKNKRSFAEPSKSKTNFLKSND
jgi:hypothetical protein